MHGLESIQRKERELQEANKPKSLFERKMRRIFGAVGDVKSMFFKGFQVGALVGGIFGGLLGTYYAIAYRTIWYIPMLAIGSGSSFGFFMGIGMIIRTEMEEQEPSQSEQFLVQFYDPLTKTHSQKPIYDKYIL